MPQEFDWAGVVDYARRHPVEPPETQYELPEVTEEMHQNVPVAVVPLLSPDQAPATASFEPERDADAQQHGLIGHNEQQFLSRVKEETTTAYGQTLRRGTVFFLRQDSDTVENPFGFSLDEQISTRPRAGVHFIGFGPSSQHFEKMRLEMDGVEHQRRYGLPEENVGFTKMLVTTHRQNFLLLPPRAYRAMPLAELL